MAPPKKNSKNAGKLKPTGFEDMFSNTILAIVVLASITFMVYARTLMLDYTKLDDSIFIVENAQYNSDAKNIGVSFQRGLFNPTKDAYYRPLFLVDFILESRLFGIKPAGYHFTNLLFHIISVVLLFLFFKRIKIPPQDSFLLSLLFAVHPVLTQAVAWIPGRNDMLLMIFFLSSFILLFKYLEKPKPAILLLHFLFLLAALFTKETAIIIPVIMGGFAVFYLKCGWRKLLFPLISWVAAIATWLLVRSTATLSKNWVSPSGMFHAGIDRLGVIVQYLGKIFFPVNLTVFPMAEDITLVWGLIALAGLIALVVYSKSYTRPLTYMGLFWFIVFLIPVLIVPKSLNDQVFEHRLYLPVIGILIMLSQAIPFSGSFNPKLKIAIVSVIVVIFIIQSFIRTSYFNDPVTFWTHAVNGSPHSAYAKTLLGTKVEDPAERERLFREARTIEPGLKNLNYYLGKVLFDRKEVDSAERYLRIELVHNPIPDAYFLLAQIAFSKNSFDSAAVNLEKVIELNPFDPQANNNLVLLYYQHGQPDKARQVIRNMQERGMGVGDDLLRMVNGK
ncbi:MAG: tetratricopeptide repeat protein [Bacteroidetes bacterium]|nr:tetratricopeptide repeat protein [Bacteroidota bacterium]